MQTFLPYADLRASCVVLDDRRLGKQRVETYQILRALTWPDYAWKNHPAVRMWRGFTAGLVLYGLENCREWVRRGYADSVAGELLAWSGGQAPVDPPLPPWFGLEELHRSHRSALLRKDPAHYRPLFGDEPDDLPYLWPPDVFPRWPVRAGGAPLSLAQAVSRLGLEQARPWQAATVQALVAGRDVLLVARPGAGATTTGLLAALTTAGRTLWLAPPAGPAAGPVPELVLPPAREPAAQSVSYPAPVARPPGPVELAAMQQEQAEPELVFAHLGDAPAGLAPGLVVVERAGEVTGPPVRDGAPVLAVVPRADADERAAVASRLGLREPVHTGGGWDPGPSRLEVATTTARGRARAVADLVRRQGQALVVVAGREQADRLARGLDLRADSWAPPPMRATRAARSVAAWRSRRLDALVVPDGPLPPLGRRRPALLVGAGVGDPERWRDLVQALAPEVAVLLVGPDSPAELQALAGQPGCRRAALLARFGEPVAVPCGRCDACAPSPAGLPSAPTTTPGCP